MASKKVTKKSAVPSTTAPTTYAGFVVRLAATIVDGVVVTILNIVVAITVVLAVFSWAIWPIYSVLCLVNWDGATVGKKLFGIKVVGKEAQLGYGTALLREVIGKFLSSMVLGLGYLWIIWDKEKQGWHDKVASTHVVHTLPFEGGRKILAWTISVLVGLMLIVLPILIILGLIPLITSLRNDPATINQSIQELRQLEESNKELQTSLEELKDLQKQLEETEGLQ
jgi:uncharacterized RDD family membrane protein YckC